MVESTRVGKRVGKGEWVQRGMDYRVYVKVCCDGMF